MKCSKCDQENIELARFCSQCGSSLHESPQLDFKAKKNEIGSYDELVDTKDKNFFIISIAGGAILAYMGLSLIKNLIFQDPLLYRILLTLSFLVLAYVFAVSIILIIRALQYFTAKKTFHSGNGGINSDLSANDSKTLQEQQKIKQLQSKNNSRIRLGSLVFAALIAVAVIVAIIIPRPQYKFIGLNIPKEFVHGDQIYVIADAENYGRAGGSFLLTLLIDDKEVQSEVLYLEARSQKSFQIDLIGDYRAGSYEVTSAIGDSKLIDHSHSSHLKILTPPEITITSLRMEPNQFDFNNIQDTVIKIKVDNIGEAAGQATLDILVDGKPELTRMVSLDGGSSENIDFHFSVEGPGTFIVSVDDVSEPLEVFYIEQPRNGAVLTNKISGGYGHLKVVNNDDVDVVFIFVKAEEPLNSLLAVYVHANSSTTVRGIRDGNYLGYFSTGLEWDSFSKRFTRFSDHGFYEDPFNYSTSHRADGYTYSIWECIFGSVVPGEGAVIQDVDPSRFPVITE